MDLADLGLIGLFLGTFLAGTVVPFSSDVLYVAILAAMPEKVVASLILATVGNTLGTITTYFVGRAGKTEWLQKYFKTSPEKIEKQKAAVTKYGFWAGIAAWVPIIGKPLLIALGFYKSKTIPTILAIAVGIAARFTIWTLILT